MRRASPPTAFFPSLESRRLFPFPLASPPLPPSALPLLPFFLSFFSINYCFLSTPGRPARLSLSPSPTTTTHRHPSLFFFPSSSSLCFFFACTRIAFSFLPFLFLLLCFSFCLFLLSSCLLWCCGGGCCPPRPVASPSAFLLSSFRFHFSCCLFLLFLILSQRLFCTHSLVFVYGHIALSTHVVSPSLPLRARSSPVLLPRGRFSLLAGWLAGSLPLVFFFLRPHAARAPATSTIV